MYKYLNKGFTIIELLVVIGIIAVLAALVIVGIDPVDKINAANDSKVQQDVNLIARAMETYAVGHDGVYVADQPTLVNAGDLKQPIYPPSGYCSNNYIVQFQADPPLSIVSCELKSKKYTSTPWWVWCSTSGKAGPTTDVSACP